MADEGGVGADGGGEAGDLLRGGWGRRGGTPREPEWCQHVCLLQQRCLLVRLAKVRQIRFYSTSFPL